MATYKEITTTEVQELLNKGENISLIDVREAHELARGKIPGVKHIPLNEVQLRMSELDKNQEHIIVCRSGNRSGVACNILAAHGYNVANMIGGMLDWQGEIE